MLRKIFLLLLVGLPLVLALPAQADIGRIHNKILGFTFVLPRGWEGYKTADDGSGYVVVVPNTKDIDGWIFTSEAEIPYTGEGRVEPFFFDDGMLGKKIPTSTSLTYSRIIRGYTITFSINGPRGWMKANRKKIEAMAKSIRPAR